MFLNDVSDTQDSKMTDPGKSVIIYSSIDLLFPGTLVGNSVLTMFRPYGTVIVSRFCFSLLLA